MIGTAIIFLLTYTVLAIGTFPGFRIDRTGAALIGATLMIVFGSISFSEAYQAINYQTLVLLFGMMVVIANLRLSGFFRWIAVKVLQYARRPHQLLAGIIFGSGFLSALFVNDTICLIFTPLILTVCSQIPCSPLPYLLALATASNIGSVATITGNPQNMLIGTFSHIKYSEFTFALAPIALMGLGVDFALISLFYKKELSWKGEGVSVQPRVRVFRPLLIKSVTATCVMVGFFFAGADIAVVALAAGAAILITRRVKPQKIYREIDWELLTLFAGLFVVIHAVEVSGLASEFFSIMGLQKSKSFTYFTAIVAVISNLVSNVPAVLLFKSFVANLSDPKTGWLVLAMSSTLAGNLTILGSIANLIVVQRAKEDVVITFWDYARLGVPLTIVTIAIGLVWLLFVL